MNDNVEKEIISIIADVSGCDIEEITPDADLINDLEVDSIKAIEIAVAVEKKYKVAIRDEDIPKIKTPRQIVEITNKLLDEMAGK